MKNKIAKYGQALAVKKLGFNEPCFGWFTLEGGGAKSMFIPERRSKQDIGLCLAPFKQDIIDWFREKHNIIGEVRYKGGPIGENAWYNYVIYSNGYSYTSRTQWMGYDEAQNACIDKLIDTLKNK